MRNTGWDRKLKHMTMSNKTNETRCLVLRAMILSCLLSGGAATSAGGELKYDFGPRGSRGADGCIRLGIGQQYSQETRYGFVHGGAGEATGSRQRSGQSDARLNSLAEEKGTFYFLITACGKVECPLSVPFYKHEVQYVGRTQKPSFRSQDSVSDQSCDTAAGALRSACLSAPTY